MIKQLNVHHGKYWERVDSVSFIQSLWRAVGFIVLTESELARSVNGSAKMPFDKLEF